MQPGGVACGFPSRAPASRHSAPSPPATIPPRTERANAWRKRRRLASDLELRRGDQAETGHVLELFDVVSHQLLGSDKGGGRDLKIVIADLLARRLQLDP